MLTVVLGFFSTPPSASQPSVMSMFLVPGLTALLGHKAWWPGHGNAVAADQTVPTCGREPVGAVAS